MRLIAVMSLAALAGFAQTGVASGRTGALQSALVREINAVRADHGLRPLSTSDELAASASQHTREMGSDGYFHHESRDASPFWKRIQHWYVSSGWSFWSVGENLFWSRRGLTAPIAISAWMASPTHRANLLSRTWREVGISALRFDAAPGTFGGRPVSIVTADFGIRR
jgi:uncharacterized protein YkwD